MSSFRVIEHSIPGQHIREYPKAISTFQEDELNIAVKQYVPLDYAPQPGDITILATHASAFPKELYEPLWDDLLEQSRKAGYSIRSIWMADVANQGASYCLNETKIGSDPNFADHARDLLAIVNHFRAEFTRPIIGIGHSMGCATLVSLSMMHPRLLTSLILIDAVIPFKSFDSMWSMPRLPSFRKDLWKTRSDAESAFRRNALVKKFDARVIDKVLAYSIRPTPTLLYPEANKSQNEPSFTLTTTKHQEAFSIVRPNYDDVGAKGLPTADERHSHPDVWDDAPFKSPFYKTEGRTCWMFLPYVRASVLWLYGGDSYAADPEERSHKMERTGTGWNGSGGAPLGRVKEDIVNGTGHFVCLEKVGECAERMSRYLEEEIEVWRVGEEKSVDAEWRRKDVVGRQTMDEQWLSQIKTWKGQRPVESKL